MTDCIYVKYWKEIEALIIWYFIVSNILLNTMLTLAVYLLYICLFVFYPYVSGFSYPSVILLFYQCICLFFYTYIALIFCPSVYLFLYPYVCLFLTSSVYFSVPLYSCFSIHLFDSLFIHWSVYITMYSGVFLFGMFYPCN